jgi:hypothetical protein
VRREQRQQRRMHKCQHKRKQQGHCDSSTHAQQQQAESAAADSAACSSNPAVPWYACPASPLPQRLQQLLSSVVLAVEAQGAACMSRQLRTLHPTAPPPPPAAAAAPPACSSTAGARHELHSSGRAAQQASSSSSSRDNASRTSMVCMVVFALLACFFAALVPFILAWPAVWPQGTASGGRHGATAAAVLLQPLPPAPAAAGTAAGVVSSHAHVELQAATASGSSTHGSSSSSAAGGGGLLRVEVCCEHDPSIVHVFTAQPQVRRKRSAGVGWLRTCCFVQCHSACAWCAVPCRLQVLWRVGTRQCCVVCLHTCLLPGSCAVHHLLPAP